MNDVLTPEQLAQLERDAKGFGGTFLVDGGDDVHVTALVFAPDDAPPQGSHDFRDHVTVITEDCDEHTIEPLARMLNAVPTLLAEIHHLRAIVDTLSRLALDATIPRAPLDCVIVDLREQAGLPRNT